MKIKLLIITLCISLLFLTSCSGTRGIHRSETETKGHSDTIPDAPVNTPPSDTLLGLTDDLGMSYIDSFIFIGESTTYHLKSRGVLSGGKQTKQVWANESGTMKLDHTTSAQKIIYPETGERLTFSEAAKRKKPEIVIMTFGLNGAVQNISLGEEYFKKCYKSLIDAIRTASPSTKIILQSAFPVAENMDMSAYSVDLKTLNQYIRTINEWTYEIADDENCKYLDTDNILKDSDGNLKAEYQVGDGHHLTTEAYKQILYYIRTHGYK